VEGEGRRKGRCRKKSQRNRVEGRDVRWVGEERRGVGRGGEGEEGGARGRGGVKAREGVGGMGSDNPQRAWVLEEPRWDRVEA